MKDIGYVDIYAKTLLQEVKSRIRQNRINISGNKEKKIDTKMVEIIKDLCRVNKTNSNFNSTYKLLPTNNEDESDRVMCTLILYYTALYNDNLDLLNSLLDEGYNFGGKPYELNLFVLVSEFSSEFKRDEYIDLLKEQSKTFRHFFFTLDENNLNGEKDIIREFKNIIEKNRNITIREERNGYRDTFTNLLTKDSIKLFGEDLILKASTKQKQNIISYAREISRWDDVNKLRLLNLMKNFNYEDGNFLFINEDLFNNFSDEEILRIEEIIGDDYLDYYDDKKHKMMFDKIKEKLDGKDMLKEDNKLFGKIFKKIKKIQQ